MESLAHGGPWLLGTITPGISRWRALREAETEIHGGSSRRRLYGCTVTMLRAPAPLQGGSSTDSEALGSESKESRSPWPGPEPPEFEQQLLTWSQVSLPSNRKSRA